LRRMWLDADERGSQGLTLGVDYKDMEGNSDASIPCNPNPIVSTCTPIQYLPFSIDYSLSSSDARGDWAYGGGMVFGIRGLVNDEQQFAIKRFQAQGNFVIFKFDLTRARNLQHGLVLSARLGGQLATQPLISDEQYVAGGVDSVRGYRESAAVGDNALRASLQLRSGNLLGEGRNWMQELQLRAFIEGAGLWLKDALPGQDSREGLLGTGFGANLVLGKGSSLALDLGWPLRDGGGTEKGTARAHATAAFQF
jgi:hemolysin activation/secretion protein